MIDARVGVTLFPHEIVNERCVSGESVTVELLGPTLGPHDPHYVRGVLPPHSPLFVVVDC